MAETVEIPELKRQLAAEKERVGELADKVERESGLSVSQLSHEESVLEIVRTLKDRTELAVAMAFKDAVDLCDKRAEAWIKSVTEGSEQAGYEDVVLLDVADLIRAKLPAATLARLEEIQRNDRRYRWIRSKTGARHAYPAQQIFTLPLDAIHESTCNGKVNLLKGSVAQHLDTAIDAAIDASAGKYERIAGAAGEYHATPDAADCKPTGNFTMTLKEPKK